MRSRKGLVALSIESSCVMSEALLCTGSTRITLTQRSLIIRVLVNYKARMLHVVWFQGVLTTRFGRVVCACVRPDPTRSPHDYRARFEGPRVIFLLTFRFPELFRCVVPECSEQDILLIIGLLSLGLLSLGLPF